MKRRKIGKGSGVGNVRRSTGEDGQEKPHRKIK